MENTKRVCCHCGKTVTPETEAPFYGRLYCENCLDALTFICDQCGARIYEADAYYEDEFDEIPLCHACYQSLQANSSIHDYSYKPQPVFYGEGERFFGVELEIDEGGKCKYNARELMELLPQNTAYIKSDGSLEDGMEIVTHPMTLRFHRERFPWKTLMEKAVILGYYSHKTDTCGLHIHVNRDSLGDSAEEQEKTISRILYFIEAYWNEMLKFSRRTDAQMKRWAARYGRKDTPQEVMRYAKNASVSRYACVNLLNRDTIEFRIFIGTLRYNTLIAALQMVNALCDLAMAYDDKRTTELTWCEFMAQLDPRVYPELIRYLKERRLYINEAIEQGEEE